MADIFYNILDEKRINILPLFSFLRDDFYLAGGTGLALQIGHRDSIDFDFFTQKDLDTRIFYDKIKTVFKNKKIKKTQEEENTLSILIDDEIRISFFKYGYGVVKKCIEAEYFRIASIQDIGCMKCSAILSRSLSKDYTDLYFIIKEVGLEKLLKHCSKKFKDVDISLILKSLVYFDDIIEEKINFKGENSINLEEVKSFIKKEVKSLDLG